MLAGHGVISGPLAVARKASGLMASGIGTDGLVEWMSLDEASGNRVGAHAGTVFTEPAGAVNSRAGKVGSAADIAGRRLEGPSGVFEIGTTASVTICQWVYFDSLTDFNFPSSAWNGGGNWGFNVAPDGAASFFLSDFGLVSTPGGVVSIGAWVFIVGWYDHLAGTKNVQVNDGPVYSAASGGSGDYRAPQLGALQNDYRIIDGALDEWCWWNRVLTSDERTWLYNAGAGRAYTDL